MLTADFLNALDSAFVQVQPKMKKISCVLIGALAVTAFGASAAVAQSTPAAASSTAAADQAFTRLSDSYFDSY